MYPRALRTASLGLALWVFSPAAPLAPPARAADAPAVVSHVTLVSDQVQDVSSLEAWKRSTIKPGMSEREKALAVWRSVVAFRHQEAPPDEFLESSGHVHDPVKAFNVYGYGQCCCASANLMALARYAGLEARGWGIVGHSVPEVRFDGEWHVLDASLITYFPKPDGRLAGVEEIARNVSEWYGANPNLKGDDKGLRKFMTRGGWKNGPELLRNCPSYDDNGWLPAATHGWYATMQEYADPGKTFVYEYGTAVGYAVNVQLRKGERLTRNWSNRGLHVNAREEKNLPLLKGSAGKGDLRYSPKYGDLAPGRVGNGLLEYAVPVASADLAAAATEYADLVASEDGTAIKDGADRGTLVLRMPTPYVYLSGRADLTAHVPEGGSIAIALSDNNGLDWKEVVTVAASGARTIDLAPFVHRRYDYRLRLTLAGPGTRLAALKLTHDVQHSQRVLPALARGRNTISFAAGPQEGTITVQGSMQKSAAGKNVLYTDFHPAAEGMKAFPPFLAGAKGRITFPVGTPGELSRLRIGVHYRARDARDGFEVSASFDDGATWRSVAQLAGPTGSGHSRGLVFEDVPPGTRAALVRFAGRQVNTTGLQDLRIDADYAEPRGGFAPVKVTYVWDEAGAEKRHVHVAARPSDTYAIDCAETPLLKSLVVERAD